ncbi:hypothetical protein PYCCODRAFT_188248 [Trametes coccinea BRFM310]|uniref:Uncharacterized protein n=1 Tax=Trametes coccinea (strain BRFM310) TaxID=1353009 RepID=A0A1Y2IRG7_TRAC3|nr:hypothetical protein PYCCODRAFT_188248 [Trametes coccinea BRFM310]
MIPAFSLPPRAPVMLLRLSSALLDSTEPSLLFVTYLLRTPPAHPCIISYLLGVLRDTILHVPRCSGLIHILIPLRLWSDVHGILCEHSAYMQSCEPDRSCSHAVHACDSVFHAAFASQLDASVERHRQPTGCGVSIHIRGLIKLNVKS